MNAFVSRHSGPPSSRCPLSDDCGCGVGWIRLALPGLFDVELTWTIPDQDGGARLWHQDRFGGLLAPLLFGSMNRHPAHAFNAMNAALKHRVEATCERAAQNDVTTAIPGCRPTSASAAAAASRARRRVISGRGSSRPAAIRPSSSG